MRAAGSTFVYADEWRNATDAYPLSLSMPLGAKEHGRAVIEAFLWGLLPDNEQVLARWAAKFQYRPATFSLSSPMSAKTARVPSSS